MKNRNKLAETSQYVMIWAEAEQAATSDRTKLAANLIMGRIVPEARRAA